MRQTRKYFLAIDQSASPDPNSPTWEADYGGARYWSLGTALTCGALAFTFTQLAEPVYQASAQVFIDPQNLQVLERDLSPTISGSDAGVVLIESQSRIMASDSVLRAAVDQLGLANDPEFVGHSSGFKLWLDRLLNGAPDNTISNEQKAVNALGKLVYVIRLDRTYIVEVYVKAGTATKAADIANAIVQQYLALRETQRSTQAEQATGALEGRLAQLLATLQDNENAVQTYKTANGIVEANGTLLLEGDVAQSNGALTGARAAVETATVQLDQLRALAGKPDEIGALPEALGSPDMARLRGELQAAQSQADVLAATLGSRHPKLLEAQGRVAAAKAALTAELARLVTNAQLNLDRAQSTLRAAEAQLNTTTGALQQTDGNRIRLRQLEREAEASQAVYQDALLRSRQTREQASLDTVNAQIISEATPPASRSFPPKLTVLLPIGLILGLGLGAAIGLALEFIRSTRRAPVLRVQPGKATSMLNLPRRRFLAGSAALSAALLATRPAGAAADGKIDIAGNRLVWRGETLRLTGLAVGDPCYIRAGRSLDDYRVIATDWAANCVRISVHPGHWRQDAAAIGALLIADIAAARAQGLFVILDWHAIGFPGLYEPVPPPEWGLPADAYLSSIEFAASFWRIAARHHANDPAVLFELWNEPVADAHLWVSTGQHWPIFKAAWETLIAEIRRYADNIILCAGGRWAHDLSAAAADLINDPRTAYAWHVYPNEDRNDPDRWFKSLNGLAGIKPVVVTEWGFCPDCDNDLSGTEADFAEPFTDTVLDALGLGHTAWCYSPGAMPALLAADGQTPSGYGTYVQTYLRNKGSRLLAGEMVS